VEKKGGPSERGPARIFESQLIEHKETLREKKKKRKNFGREGTF